MNGAGILGCNNCGGAGLAEISPDEWRCEYCGTTLKLSRMEPSLFNCPRCTFENEPGARYCNQCGLALEKWVSREKPKADLAIASILATVLGSFFVPVGGAILDLILAYKARVQAQASGCRSGSAEFARIAIAVGWIGLAIGLFPLCILPAMLGGQMGLSICGGMTELPAVLLGG